jgi:WhiB family redox-sensing transcriptional regulator
MCGPFPVPQATKHDAGTTTTTTAGTACPNRSLTLPSLEEHMADGPSEMNLFDLLDDLTTYGECRFDPELHTGPDAFTVEPAADRMAREDAAREVCEDCPVWDLCLERALRLPKLPAAGIWAGYTTREIAALRRDARQLGEAA